MLGGQDTHPWSATKGGNPTPATMPVPTKNNQETTHTSHNPSQPVESFKKAAMIYRFKKITTCKKFLETQLLSITVPTTQTALPIWRAIEIRFKTG